MKTALAILIAAFSASCAHQVTLKVVDPSGKPVKGAVPILQPLFSPASDRKGRLSVDQRYTHAIHAPGYEIFPADFDFKEPGRKTFQHQETVILQPKKSSSAR